MSDLKVNSITGSTSAGVHIPGHVLQVIHGGRTTRATVSGTTFTDIGVSALITPTSTTSKILVTVSGIISNNTNNGYYSLLKLFRDNTEIGSGTGAGSYNSFVAHLNTAAYETNGFSQQHLDSPNSTSEITYKIQLGAHVNSIAVVGGRGDTNDHANPTTITLMEIAQ